MATKHPQGKPQNDTITLNRFDYEQLIENIQMLAQNFDDLAILLLLCQADSTAPYTKTSLARLGSFTASEYGETAQYIAKTAQTLLKDAQGANKPAQGGKQ